MVRDIRQEFQGVTIKTRGLSKATRAMSKAGADSEDMRELMQRLGMIVVNEAKGIAPVRSGRLRDSIRAGKSKTKAVVRAGFRTVPYAPVVHYGWDAHNIEAQPYMLQALANVREEVVREYEQGLHMLLRKNNLAPVWGNAAIGGGIVAG